MKNIELLKMLNDVDERFLTEEYQPINNKRNKVSFKERVSDMKNVKLKYVLTPMLVAVIAVVGYVGFYSASKNNKIEDIMLAKNNDINEESIVKTEDTQNISDVININELGVTSQFNIDARGIKVNLADEFEFINKIYIPESLKELEQSKVYVRKNIEDTDYSEFKQYRIMYIDKANEDNNYIIFDFSKNKLLPDCIPSRLENGEVSIIDGTPAKIFASERIDETGVISGEAYFEYNNYKFGIEAYRITKEEFIKFVSSIIKEVKKDKKMVNDKDVGAKEFPSENNTSADMPFYYGGKYIDDKGNNVILLTDDNEVIRKEICQKLGITEERTTFLKVKYSYNYLTELQYRISSAMVEKELPFVMSSSLKEDTNNIVVIVTSNDTNDLNKLKSYDIFGNAIEIKYMKTSAIVE